MSPISSALMSLLGVSGAARTPADASPARVEGGDFASLLQQARAGMISSGREVRIPPNAGVNLSADQLTRLAAAADRAEAEGATRALVLIDGMALRLDVTMREITGVADLSQAGVVTGVDAVISVPAPTTDTAPTPLPWSGAALNNPSLLKSLAQRDAAAR